MHLTESVFHSILSNKDFYTFFHTRIFPVYLEIYIIFPVSIVSRFTKFEKLSLLRRFGDSNRKEEKKKDEISRAIIESEFLSLLASTLRCCTFANEGWRSCKPRVHPFTDTCLLPADNPVSAERGWFTDIYGGGVIAIFIFGRSRII